MADLDFTHLVDIEQIRELLEAHYKITGIGAGILDTDENILVAVGYHDICTRFHLVHPVAKSYCRESDAFIKAHLSSCTDGYLDYRCKNGLVDIAVPIMIGGEHFATFFTGQFFYDDDTPDVEYFRKQAKEFGFDEAAYLEALGRVPVFSRDRIRKTVEYFRVLVRIITGMGIRNLELRREAAELKKAKEALLISRFCIDQAGIGIYRTDESGTIFSVNDHACRSLGYTEDELLALSVFDIDPVITRERMLELKKILDAEGSVTHESIHRRKDGTTFPVEITANLLEFNGKIYGISFVKDITERKNAEEAQLLSQFCINKAAVGIFHISPHDGRIMHVNESAIRSLGYTSTELENMTVFDVDPSLTRIRFNELERMVDQSGPLTIEALHRRKDGTTYPAEVTVNDLKFQGKKHGFAFFRDITERKQVEDELLLTQHCVDKASIAIHKIYADGTISHVNEQMCRNLGYTRAELDSMNVVDFDPALTPEKLQELAGLVRENGTYTFESLNRRKDGTMFPVEITIDYLNVYGQELGMAFVQDITERKQAEEALRKAHDELESKVRERTEQLNAITYELSLAEERERRRIAGELHDQVGQSLILSKLKLDSIFSAMSADELEALLSEIRGHLGKSIENIRSLTFQLSPPLLYEVGFEAAVEWLAEEFEEKSGLRVYFHDDKKPKPLDEKGNIILYQMVRELLINIAKHAAAKNVNISIVKAQDKIRVTVADDGKGIDPAMSLHTITRNGTFGLFNIRHRIEHLGGSLKIESETGCGTSVTLDLPLRQDSGADNNGRMNDNQNHTRG